MRSDDIFGVILVLSVIGMIGMITVVPVYLLYGTAESHTVTVDRMWQKSHGDGGQVYLFSDKVGNVYSIEDSTWKWQYDASNRYAAMKENHTYEIETWGRRSPFFTNYPNALKIEEIT